MIIKSISAENFGKFDRYSVNLDENINVFFGDNEAGKTTLYEVISILLFAPTNEEEIKESNKLIKSDEKYARVYATIIMDGKEISIAREIYVNDTNLSIADQENVSSLGNVNVPFIGDLSKEMYESFHTIDYYNMATISKNVWQQIIQVVEDSHGAPRRTPDYSSPEDEIIEKQKAKFEDEIAEKERQKAEFEAAFKDAQKKQKRMIKNQDKIDDIINELEDIENHIELESSYLKEAEKMNQIRSTIKKTQDLTLELEKYKELKPWMPNLRERYERLKLYSENKASGIENPLNMFDDLEIEETAEKQDVPVTEEKPNQDTTIEKTEPAMEEPQEVKEEKQVVKPKQQSEQESRAKDKEDTEKVTYHEIVELTDEDMSADTEQTKETVEEKQIPEAAEEETQQDAKKEQIETSQTNEEVGQTAEEIVSPADDEEDETVSPVDEGGLTLEEKYKLAAEKINSIIESNYISQTDQAENQEVVSEDKANEEEQLNNAAAEFVSKNLPRVYDGDAKPLEIRKPLDKEKEELKETGVMNSFGQTNPYSDNIFPDMDDVDYSGNKISKIKERLKNTEDDDKHMPSTSNTLPTQTQKVSEEDMNGNEASANPEDKLLEAEEFLNNINMQDIITLSKEEVEVDDEAKEEIGKAQLRYKVIARRVFEQEMDIDELSQKLRTVDTNIIYKSIVKYKGLSQKQRKMEQTINKEEVKPKTKSSSILFGIIAIFSLLLGLGCFFVDQIMFLFPDIKILTEIYNIIMGLPLDNIVAGNILAGGSFVLIAILLTVAIILDSDKIEDVEQDTFDEVELDDLKNDIRMAKREVVDALENFPIPPSYLDDPNNAIINVITELRDAESVYHEAIFESKMPKNETYRTLWRVVKAHLNTDEISDDLFDNISRLRRKIQNYKEEKAEKQRQLEAAKMQSKFSTDTTGLSNASGMQFSKPVSTKPQTPPETESAPEDSTFKFNPIITSGTENEIPPAQNASESSSFGLPTATSQSTEEPIEQMPAQEQSAAMPFPAMKEPAKDEYPDNTNGLKDTKDFSYPEGGGMFGASKNTSYPEGGGVLGEHISSEYSGSDETLGSESKTEFGLGTMPEEEQQTAPVTEQTDSGFDIPGVNRYLGGAQETKESTPDNNVFGSENQLPKMGESDDPFGIPGIKRYTGQEQEMENTKTDPFARPAAESSANEISSQFSDNDDPFGIPGIKRYKYEPPVGEEQTHVENSDIKPVIKDVHKNKENGVTATDNQPADVAIEDKFEKIKQERQLGGFKGGLPGMDKFSNRNDNVSAVKEVSDEIDIPAVPPVPTPEQTAAASVIGAGALASSKLPGLDRFSNRSETIDKKQPSIDELTNEPVVEPTDEEPNEISSEQTMEADPFGIPSKDIEKDSTEAKDDAQEPQEDQTIEQEQPEEETSEDSQDEQETEEQSQEIEQDEDIEEPTDNVEAVTEKIKIIKRDRREKELDELLKLLGDDPESTIRDIEDVTRALQREISKRDSAMDELLKLNDAAIRLSTLSSNKWPYKQKAIDASRERIDYLEADKLKKQRHLKMMEEKIEADEFEDTPQAISDKIKALEDEIEQLKLESDKHALAEELIQQQKILDMSSSEDRSHIIDDTSTYMKELTLGKYVQVKVNDDLSGLSICDSEGQWYDTTKDRLSQATREQLYLALRISIADLFDEKSIIFPMFFDEALITWDKRRMKAVMRLLSKMSTHRQVIIFTCHDWLKDMISDYMIGAKIIMM